MADDLVPIGRVGRPHGVDGAFVVDAGSDDPRRFEIGASLLVAGEPATVEVSRRVGGGRQAIRLDRPVERGAELAVHRSDLGPADPDHFYVFELVGLDVVEDGDGGRRLGSVKDVLPGVANDSLELDSGQLIPMVEDCVREIDVASGRIVIALGFVPDG